CVPGDKTEASKDYHLKVRITRPAHSRSGTRGLNKLVHVVVLVRTAEDRTIVSPWDDVESQTIQGKELGSLRCIARVKQAEWKSVREGQDAAELPSISQSLFETRPLRFEKVEYDVRHEIIPHDEQRPA